MKISTSTFYHKSHYPVKVTISRASAMAQALQQFYFSLTNIFLEKIEHLYLVYLNILSFAQLFCVNITLIKLLISLQFRTHPKASIGVLDKWMLEFSEATVYQRFGKNGHLEYFWQLSSKTSMLESFLSTLGSFSKSCSEQLFCREPI